MAPVNEPLPSGSINGVPKDDPEDVNGPRKFTFPSHQFHMVHLAKMCQENKDYTDCVIRVGEEELRAHRLVLGSVSPFLKLVFSDLPANHTEATILVPGVRQRVVKALLDFFYTGQMTVERQDTSDLQLLIDTLQIDPGLITVDAVDSPPDPDPAGASNDKEETPTDNNTDNNTDNSSREKLRRKRKNSDAAEKNDTTAKSSRIDEEDEASK